MSVTRRLPTASYPEQWSDGSAIVEKVTDHRNRRWGEIAFVAFMLAGAASICACDGPGESGIAGSDFQAEVSGAVTGRMAGPGLVRYIPPSQASFGPRPGYFFVADDSGVRPLGITFTIPADTGPGTYPLVSGHPMEIGTHYEVRVDASVGDRTDSFQKNTKGTITIEAFPSESTNLAGGRVAGHFDFSTQNGSGGKISAEGSFDFHGS